MTWSLSDFGKKFEEKFGLQAKGQMSQQGGGGSLQYFFEDARKKDFGLLVFRSVRSSRLQALWFVKERIRKNVCVDFQVSIPNPAPLLSLLTKFFSQS